MPRQQLTLHDRNIWLLFGNNNDLLLSNFPSDDDDDRFPITILIMTLSDIKFCAQFCNTLNQETLSIGKVSGSTYNVKDHLHSIICS